MQSTSRALLLLSSLALACAHSHPPDHSTGLWELPWRLGQLKSIRLGPPFRLSLVTPLAEITASPGLINKVVRTRGRIASVCNEAGCWIDIWPLAGGGEGVLVNSLDKSFSHPLDCVGRIAEVEGRHSLRTYPPERTRHWAHHGWRSGLQIRGPIKVHRIEATTVEIRSGPAQRYGAASEQQRKPMAGRGTFTTASDRSKVQVSPPCGVW